MANLFDTVGMDTSGLALPPTPTVNAGDPAWDIARFFPAQGKWTEEQYLEVSESVNRFVELNDGFIEILPMPTIEHQFLARFLLDALRGFVEPRDLGTVLFGPIPTWLDAERYREPDLLYATKERQAASDKYYRGIDLAVEIVIPDEQSHKRDWVVKREQYAAAGVQEYWIIDPQQQRVMVLALEGDKYVEHGDVIATGTAESKLLEGFSVDVAEVFAAGKQH